MSSRLRVALLLIVFANVFSSSFLSVDAELVKLTRDNMFDVLNTGKKTVFVMYSESWCHSPGFSKIEMCEFVHRWKNFAEKYPSTGDIIIAEGDAEEHGKVVKGKPLTFWIHHPSFYGDDRSGPYTGTEGKITMKALKQWYREEVAAFKLKQAAREGQEKVHVASAGQAHDEAEL